MITKPKTPKPVKAWALVNKDAPYIYAHWLFDEREDAKMNMTYQYEVIIPVRITPIVPTRKEKKK